MNGITSYEEAFNDIAGVNDGWIQSTLYNDEATKEELIRALTYLNSMIETYSHILKRSDINERSYRETES